MNRKRMKWLLPLIVVAVGILITAALVMAGPEVETVEPERTVPLMRVVEAEMTDVRLVIDSQGTVEPSRRSEVTGQVAGRIVWISPELASGGSFMRGEVMARIDPRDQQVAVQNAQAAVAQARVRLAREEAESKLALEEWEDLGSGNPSPLVLREPQVAEARASLEAAEASLAQARLNLDRTAITAPFGGRVTRRLADVGQFVSPGAPIATLYATDYAEIELPVTSEELGFIDLPRAGANGPRVVLRGNLAGTERAWEARIVRTSGVIDPSTRMVNLIARVENPFEATADGIGMQAGIFVSAEIEGREVRDVFILPREALRRDDRVFVADESGPLRIRRVGVVTTRESTVIVSTGLSEGDLVILSPIETPVDGMEVRFAREQPPDAGPDQETVR